MYTNLNVVYQTLKLLQVESIEETLVLTFVTPGVLYLWCFP